MRTTHNRLGNASNHLRMNWQRAIEALENRQCLAADIVLNGTTGQLNITGSTGNDTAIVSQVQNTIATTLFTPDGPIYKNFAAAQVTSLDFDGGAGNDTLRNSTGLKTRAFGGSGDDRLEGGSGVDHLIGADGNDVLVGNGGNDLLEGGNGRDLLEGSADNDALYGYGETDNLFGGPGIDNLFAGDGNDYMDGNDGSDWLSGEGGHDTEHGSSGNDSVYGDVGNDTLYGGDGIDTLQGGPGDDVLDGQNGYDHILGNLGYDRENDGEDQFEDADGEDQPRGSSSVTGSPIVFNANGAATLSGTFAGHEDYRYYNFTAANSGTLTVNLSAGANGRFGELQIKDVANSAKLLDLEPSKQGGRTSATISVIAGRSYNVKLESSDSNASAYNVSLLLT